MTGFFIDNIRFKFNGTPSKWTNNAKLLSTDYGEIRVLDTGSKKPVILSVPDGPNMIEHHENLISQLSNNFRVICFELPGIGFSYPNSKYDYSLEKSAKLIINIMDILKIERAMFSFSCSNGFYAIKTAELYPERVSQLLLSQTPSLHAMNDWTVNAIPKLLRYPIVGQVVNSFSEKKLAKIWYNYALPKTTDNSNYKKIALHNFHNGGCFCLSSLVQGLSKEINNTLKVLEVPSTLIWGNKDYTHRATKSDSIKAHLPNCNIVEFTECGHFPELENTKKYVSLLNNL
jgi:pimeloyl-ACP methyl ester carboxylesterase